MKRQPCAEAAGGSGPRSPSRPKRRTPQQRPWALPSPKEATVAAHGAGQQCGEGAIEKILAVLDGFPGEEHMGLTSPCGINQEGQRFHIICNAVFTSNARENATRCSLRRCSRSAGFMPQVHREVPPADPDSRWPPEHGGSHHHPPPPARPPHPSPRPSLSQEAWESARDAFPGISERPSGEGAWIQKRSVQGPGRPRQAGESSLSTPIACMGPRPRHRHRHAAVI